LLFGESAEAESDKGKKGKEAGKGPNKKIERVVVCYEDGTFASYEADV
jgi:hypothetical protein